MNKDEARKDAVEKLTEDIFTDGRGEKAMRLVMEFDGQRMGGTGWSRIPIADKLRSVFDAGVAYAEGQTAERVKELEAFVRSLKSFETDTLDGCYGSYGEKFWINNLTEADAASGKHALEAFDAMKREADNE